MKDSKITIRLLVRKKDSGHLRLLSVWLFVALYCFDGLGLRYIFWVYFLHFNAT